MISRQTSTSGKIYIVIPVCRKTSITTYLIRACSEFHCLDTQAVCVSMATPLFRPGDYLQPLHSTACGTCHQDNDLVVAEVGRSQSRNRVNWAGMKKLRRGNDTPEYNEWPLGLLGHLEGKWCNEAHQLQSLKSLLVPFNHCLSSSDWFNLTNEDSRSSIETLEVRGHHVQEQSQFSESAAAGKACVTLSKEFISNI